MPRLSRQGNIQMKKQRKATKAEKEKMIIKMLDTIEQIKKKSRRITGYMSHEGNIIMIEDEKLIDSEKDMRVYLVKFIKKSNDTA